MRLDRPQLAKLTVIVVFLLLAILFIVLMRGLNASVTPAQPNEETHASHSTEEGSQLVIEGIGRLEEEDFSESMIQALTSQLYASHYDKHSKLEREAILTGVKNKGETTTITVKFTPSGDTLTAYVTIHNTATNDFDIEIEGGKK